MTETPEQAHAHTSRLAEYECEICTPRGKLIADIMAKTDSPAVVCSICEQEAAHPELRGTMWHRKGDMSLSVTWSRTLIEMAGDYETLTAEWEMESPPSPRQLRDSANGPWDDD